YKYNASIYTKGVSFLNNEILRMSEISRVIYNIERKEKMANILKYTKKQLEKTLKDFVKKENIVSNDVSEWIRIINDFIYDFELRSEINEEDKLSITTNKEEQVVIEKMMFALDGSKVSLNYIFDGNITYVEEDV
ncbi:hypothetical protein LGK97_19665, partial [Clostridium sp. CS001]|uniref:hypothetical protein n=1 Tax=Clostridium sp. CS001 TaxID=2880648 RepID=UPI001CF1F7C2